VVFTVRLERDVSQDNHLVVSVDLLECALEVSDGVLLIAAEPVFVGLGDAPNV
jgi:hypothetical protein